MSKHILVTGANGQLGNEMRNILTRREDVVAYFTDVNELDITSKGDVDSFFDNHPVDYLVNCAAYTAVDKAEDAPELCARLNAHAVALLAEAAHNHGAKMVQISTDYVFNGENFRPYREDDATCPVSVYGETKLKGEKQLLEIAPDSVILRTAWLYSPYGHNFVKTMINLGHEKKQLKVIFDQVGTPTYAKDLATAVMVVIDAPAWHSGIYHFSDEGAISWYDFAQAIHRLAGIETCTVLPCRTQEYPTRAHRPHYSVLDKSKFKATFNTVIPYWVDSLAHCIARITTHNE